jgi:hypothetical protein
MLSEVTHTAPASAPPEPPPEDVLPDVVSPDELVVPLDVVVPPDVVLPLDVEPPEPDVLDVLEALPAPFEQPASTPRTTMPNAARIIRERKVMLPPGSVPREARRR